MYSVPNIQAMYRQMNATMGSVTSMCIGRSKSTVRNLCIVFDSGGLAVPDRPSCFALLHLITGWYDSLEKSIQIALQAENSAIVYCVQRQPFRATRKTPSTGLRR